MTIDTQAALKYFKATDPIMYQLLTAGMSASDPIAVPKAKPPTQYFASIVSSIISQQISTKAADAVRGRVITLVGTLTPANILAVTADDLKSCGLSGQKVKYLTHNAAIWHDIPAADFVHMPDEEIITELTKLYGIGRWTAEMFLMFSMARPDVFSLGDLGLMQELYCHYSFKPHYVRKIDTTIASWSPHRTSAALALWYGRDKGPVLL